MSFAEKRFAYGYVAKILQKGYNLTNEQKEALVLKLYARDEKRPLLKFKNLIRRQTVQNMTQDALLELTETHGITAKEALEKRNEVLKGAIADKNWNAANKALDAFDDKLDLQPQKVTVTKTIEGDMSHLLPVGDKTKLKAKEKRVIEGNEKTE